MPLGARDTGRTGDVVAMGRVACRDASGEGNRAVLELVEVPSAGDAIGGVDGRAFEERVGLVVGEGGERVGDGGGAEAAQNFLLDAGGRLAEVKIPGIIPGKGEGERPSKVFAPPGEERSAARGRGSAADWPSSSAGAPRSDVDRWRRGPAGAGQATGSAKAMRSPSREAWVRPMSRWALLACLSTGVACS